jgi:hypothetical protein
MVICGALQTFTGPFAIAQMVFQADLKFFFVDIGFRQVQFTGPERDICANELDQFPDPCDGSKRTQVFRTIQDLFSG